MASEECDPLTDEALARWIETTPPPPWWAASDGEWGLFCVLVPPDPDDPSAGSVPENVRVPPEWDPCPVDDGGDNDETEWRWRPESPAEAPGVDWPDLVRLAWYARMRLPGLVSEVARLRAALADLAAEEGAVPPPPADGNLVYAEGYADGADMMAVRAYRALKGEAGDD